MKLTVEGTANEVIDFLRSFAVTKENVDNAVEEHCRRGLCQDDAVESKISGIINDGLRKVFSQYAHKAIEDTTQVN